MGRKTGSHQGGGYKDHMLAPPVATEVEAVDLDEIKDEIESDEFKVQVPSEEEVMPETSSDTVVVATGPSDIKRVTYVEAPKASEVKKNQFGAEFYFSEEGEKIFVSGSWRRCPRCGALDTKNIRNQDVVMGSDRAYIYHHRQCTRPVCRHRFKAMRPN